MPCPIFVGRWVYNKHLLRIDKSSWISDLIISAFNTRRIGFAVSSVFTLRLRALVVLGPWEGMLLQFFMQGFLTQKYGLIITSKIFIRMKCGNMWKCLHSAWHILETVELFSPPFFFFFLPVLNSYVLWSRVLVLNNWNTQHAMNQHTCHLDVFSPVGMNF